MNSINNSIFIKNDYNDDYTSSKTGSNNEKQDIKLEDISIMYTTDKTEKKRSAFDDTFKQVSLNGSENGKKFLESLISNKDTLMEDLNLEPEEYDNMACIALAIASQETGMGEEKWYNEENNGLLGFLRILLKSLDNSSASSGLTQLKIYDFLNTDGKLTEEEKDVIKKYGITVKGKSIDNLYKNPDKSAVATMVILSSINNNYDNYKNLLSSKHQQLENDLINMGITPEKAEEKGKDLLQNITDTYNNFNDTKTKSEFRKTLKQFFLAHNNSKMYDINVDKNYNEEIQLNKLNDILNKNNVNFNLNMEDLNYLRYILTSDNQEMTRQEYCAYGWNKGTDETGMQLDRLLADKIGTILVTPGNFDFDQYTVNVDTLADMYKNQGLDN